MIATRWAGIAEIVSDEEGLLVPPKDVDALALSMTCLIDSPERLIQMKKAAKSRAKYFDSNYWASRFTEICEEIAWSGNRMDGQR